MARNKESQKLNVVDRKPVDPERDDLPPQMPDLGIGQRVVCYQPSGITLAGTIVGTGPARTLRVAVLDPDEYNRSGVATYVLDDVRHSRPEQALEHAITWAEPIEPRHPAMPTLW